MHIGVVGPFNPLTVQSYFKKSTALPNINRMATSVNCYVNGLLKTGHKVTVFTSYSFDGDPYTIEGNNIRICLVSTRFKIHGLSRLRMAKRIQKEIKPFLSELDVLHAEWTYEYALAIKSFKNRIPVFCSVRDWAPYLYRLAKGIKEKYYWGLSLFVFKKVMKGNELHLIANSEYTEKQILSRYPTKDVVIIPNPMDSKNILKSRENYPENPVFISISTSPFTPRKNNLILLHAFSVFRQKYPMASLIIIGACSDELKMDLEKKGLLEGVRLTGSLDHDEVIRCIDQSSCLVHPALEETFGNILLEGMCRRVPCIGGNKSGAVPQVLGYGKYGILCDVTNISSIVEALTKAIEDTNKRDQLINDCTKYIADSFSETVIARSHLELFSKFVSS